MAGLWQEGGPLDALDKALSRPVFHLELPWLLEVALSMPGMWFCCGPIYPLAVVPAGLMAMAPQTKTFRFWVCVPVLVVAAGVWMSLCLDSTFFGHGVHRAYMHDRPEAGLLFLGLPYAVVFLSYLSSPAGRRAVVLWFSSFFVSLKAASFAKRRVLRLRPMVALAAELHSVRRALPDANAQQRQPSEVSLSFPSGDSAAGAACAVVLLLTCPGLRGKAAAVLLLLLTGLGRMYFHCHHLLDVVAGELLGIAVTVLWSRCCGGMGVTLAQVILIFLP